MANTFDIYQIDRDGAGRDFMYMGSRLMEHFGASIRPENYKKCTQLL